MQNKTKAFLWVFSVFVFGALFGATLTYYLAPVRAVDRSAVKQEKPRKPPIEVLKERLHLREDQVPQIEAILKGARQRYKSIGQEADQKFQEARKETRDRIRALLDEDQRRLHEVFLQELDKRHREWRPHDRR